MKACSSPETICVQCGDVGYTNAFVYCVKCLKFAVHRYCLNVMPASVDEFVQWVCDDCDVKMPNQPAISKNDAIQCETGDRTAPKHSLDNSDFGMKKNDIIALNIEKPVYKSGPHQSYDACAKLNSVECTKSASDCCPVGFRETNDELVLSAADTRKRYKQGSSQRLEEEINDNLIRHDKLSADAPTKEVTKIKRSATTVSTVRNDQRRIRNNSFRRPPEKCASVGISECAKLASDSTQSTEVKDNKSSEIKDDCHLSRQHCEWNPEPGAAFHRVLSCNSYLGSLKKRNTNTLSEANLESLRYRTPIAQHLKEQKRPDIKTQGSEGRSSINISKNHNKNRESEGSDDRAFASHHESNFHKGSSKDSTVSSAVDCNILAEPLMKPIWRGGFNIQNKDIVVDLMAHISSLACQKVHDEARQFKSALHFEMLPKSDVWPKSFEMSEPSGENIALYFFPSEMRSERVIDHLIDEMADNELALRAKVQKAELLVFTSMELPLPYWRFQGKYYLWGVFREKHDPVLRSQSSQSESRYNPVMHKDRLDDTGSSGGGMPATTKVLGGRSPLSPLSNCSSYGSGS